MTDARKPTTATSGKPAARPGAKPAKRKADPRAAKGAEQTLAKQSDNAVDAIANADTRVHDAIKVSGATKAGKTLDAVADFNDHGRLAIVNGAVLAGGLIARKPELVRAGLRMFAAQGVALGVRGLLADRLHAIGRPTATEAAKGMASEAEVAAGAVSTGSNAATIAVSRAAARGNPMPFIPARLMGYAVTGSNAPRKANFVSDFLIGTAIGWLAETVGSTLVDRGGEAVGLLPRTPPKPD